MNKNLNRRTKTKAMKTMEFNYQSGYLNVCIFLIPYILCSSFTLRFYQFNPFIQLI